MKSEWRITSNYINGKTMYAVYRLINANEVDHSGNREYGEIGYVSSREETVSVAEALNKNEVYEEKRRFVRDLWKALKNYYPEIESMKYAVNGNHMEFVVLSYINGATKKISVTADSLSAMLRDVSKWL